MTNVCAGFTSNENGWNNDIETQYNENIKNINQEFQQINDKLIDLENETQQIKVKLTETQQKLDEIKEKINDNFTRLQTWLGRLGGYIHTEITNRGWPNIPQVIKIAPSLYIE